MQRISITLPDELIVLLNEKVEKGTRSSFITQAITEALKKEEKWEAYQALENLTPFDVEQDSSIVLNNIRKGRQIEVAEKGQDVSLHH